MLNVTKNCISKLSPLVKPTTIVLPSKDGTIGFVYKPKQCGANETLVGYDKWSSSGTCSCISGYEAFNGKCIAVYPTGQTRQSSDGHVIRHGAISAETLREGGYIRINFTSPFDSNCYGVLLSQDYEENGEDGDGYIEDVYFYIVGGESFDRNGFVINLGNFTAFSRPIRYIAFGK